jgi:MFS family permease
MTPITYYWWGGVGAFPVIALINGMFTLGGFAWFAIYLPELFGSSIRSAATGFIFNVTRLIAWIGPIVSGLLIASFGGVSQAAVYMGSVYVPGILMLPFLRETKDEPLPPSALSSFWSMCARVRDATLSVRQVPFSGPRPGRSDDAVGR